MLKSFPALIDRIKQDQLVLRELIKTYGLDDQRAIVPQIEEKLERKLTRDEKLTIEFAIGVIKAGGYTKTDTFAGKKSQYHRRRSKKKK